MAGRTQVHTSPRRFPGRIEDKSFKSQRADSRVHFVAMFLLALSKVGSHGVRSRLGRGGEVDSRMEHITLPEVQSKRESQKRNTNLAGTSSRSGPAGPMQPPLQVWDAIFSPDALSSLVKACDDHAGSLTVFDRQAAPRGRTIIEQALISVLEQLGDDSRYVEYWWRDEWIDMEVHRDHDEVLCGINCRRSGSNSVRMHRCPIKGHVLYIDVGANVRGPTCLWQEVGTAVIDDASDDILAGPVRDLQALHVVPAKSGRLLRFRGDMLHAVPKPTLQWLQFGNKGDEQMSGPRRSVLLFNLWGEPPMDPPGVYDPPPNEKKATKALAESHAPPVCLSHQSWVPVGATTILESIGNLSEVTEDRSRMSTVSAPLLGEESRHGCKSNYLVSDAPEEKLREALLSDSAIYAVPLYPSRKQASHDYVAPEQPQKRYRKKKARKRKRAA